MRTKPNTTYVFEETILYCAELGHAEIKPLKTQKGLPVLAEVVRKKVKFVS